MQALIFDFDGLMIDSETPDYQSWQEVYQSYGCDLALELWAGLIGLGANDKPFDLYAHLEELSGRAIDREAIRQQRRLNFVRLFEQQTILPGVEDYIHEARALGLKLGVASSGRCAWIEAQLARLGLRPYFAAVRCADHVQRTKPDPEVYLAALDDLNIQPAQAIALEDSVNGVTAAVRAGMFAVAVPNSMTAALNFDHAHVRLNSLVDLPLSALLEQAQRSLSS